MTIINYYCVSCEKIYSDDGMMFGNCCAKQHVLCDDCQCCEECFKNDQVSEEHCVKCQADKCVDKCDKSTQTLTDQSKQTTVVQPNISHII